MTSEEFDMLLAAQEECRVLRAENTQLRSAVASAQAALQELRLAWCMERLAREDRIEEPAQPALVLAWPERG